MRVEACPSVGDRSITLRAIERSDQEAWYAYLSMPGAIEHTSWILNSAADLTNLFETYDSTDPASSIRFAIIRDQVLIGTIGFHTISPVNRTAEIAFDLHPDYWGRGIASLCCTSAVAWGFSDRHYARIQATALDTNAASIRVLEKCGFIREGKLRSYRMVRGEPRDFWMYARVCVTNPR